ncbi:uncharacterized protein PFL1_05888 [Pseudozyma flocculosa PF-1]|uniref:ThuA-like domain-containing protein n=1 Tax=Pseudozyma flocculosa PF-1 TaxID=1277687 RepID=A0A061H1Q4_9BASI|nr:uncharacterized protein PFL1_05888 [Pseudozyma flocculosa PF-1]EPQ26567.1 hypothetical protein PFL1_05888 [Pseudozyma flocculosa PF-1]
MRWSALAAIGSALLAQQAHAVPHILLYTRTAGYRHESIPTAVDTITGIGNGTLRVPSGSLDASIADLRWQATATSDQAAFRNATYLAQFDAIAFIMTTDIDPPGAGTVLDDEGIRNFATYIQNGGGYVGIHSASATLFGAPFYGRLVGAYFDYHPQIQSVSLKPVATDHPSTSKLPGNFDIQEEVYNFRSDPRKLPSPANVLITNASNYQDPGVNPQGFRNGTNGPAPHPLAWYREGRLLDTDGSTDASVRGGGGANVDPSGGPGRSWYTSLGHDRATWQQDFFRGHIAGGVGWVLQSSTVKSNNATALVGQPGPSSSGGGGASAEASSTGGSASSSGGAGATSRSASGPAPSGSSSALL